MIGIDPPLGGSVVGPPVLSIIGASWIDMSPAAGSMDMVDGAMRADMQSNVGWKRRDVRMVDLLREKN